jgi:hypothetical protein
MFEIKAGGQKFPVRANFALVELIRLDLKIAA